MKKYLLMNLPKLLSVGLLLFTFSSCEKESMSVDTVMSGTDRSARTAVCSAFNYADSVFYIRNQVADYVVSPVTALAGTYGASPWGLSINPTTGAINVSKSETGLTYKVFFVKAGTADTCTRDITISGVDFASSIHFLSKKDTAIKPTYKGRTSSTDRLAINWNFDLDGLTSILPIRSLGIAINQLTAIIDLKQTVLNGTFGAVPKNGASRTVRLYYTIDDASKKAVNHIDLRLTYYDQLSDVPATMVNKLLKPQSARVAATTSWSTESTGARPPDIVIVGH